jgi:hypothetical protein
MYTLYNNSLLEMMKHNTKINVFVDDDDDYDYGPDEMMNGNHEKGNLF